MNNKRGQELSTNTIILVILGVIVLVILILGFTIGWDRFLPFISSNNIENLQAACSTACTTSNQYDYCSLPRDVNDGVNDKFTSNCNELATNATYVARNYGIDSCSSVTCTQAG